MPRSVWISLLVSLTFHLIALFVADELWYREMEAEVFRARLLTRPKFIQPRRASVAPPSLPRVRMEYLTAVREPGEIDERPLADAGPAAVDPQAITVPRFASEEPGTPKSGGPELDRVEMPTTAGVAAIDSFESEAMELLRLEDLARVDDKRAVVIADPRSKRDIRGFVHFTSLWLDGAGSYHFGFKPVLDDLARFMRAQSQVEADMRHGSVRRFLAEALLEDPVHFLFPMERHQGNSASERIQLIDEEVEMLGRYLQGGGFLFVDAGVGPDGRWFLKEMVRHLKRALGSGGGLFEIPLGHGVYHSFYNFGAGFPYENKKEKAQIWEPSWYYPDLPPGMPPRGLWGIDWQGELVGVISDLDMHSLWSGELTYCDTAECSGVGQSTPDERASSTTRFLMAGTNVVAYALTRPGGVAIKRARPAWEQRAPEVPLVIGVDPEPEEPEQDVLDGLDASLALVRMPLGKPIGEDGLRLVVDDVWTLDVLDRGIDGLVLRNLPGGKHQIELEYAGRRQRVEVELKGGRVLTVGFKLRGLGFFTLLHLNPFAEKVRAQDWDGIFQELVIEEFFFVEDVDF